jgi:hypothetical protein
MSRRLAVAAALLLLAGGAWAWAAWAGHESPPSEVQGVRVVVVGRDGNVSHDGVVFAEANPLAALHGLALARGFAVEVEDQSWIGSGCTRHYVLAIDGQRETATGGWNYYVRQPGGDWEWGSTGAACFALAAGDEVEWCWVELDVCRAHAP